ncbi:MAG: ATP-binding protein [Burkholderia sp.]
MLLASPVPLVMLWGQPGTMIYNDAYSSFAGGRHPFLLGKPVEEGWPEIAAFNRHVVDTGLSGGTLSYTDKQLTLHRSGRPEDVWMDLHYSPVAEDDGRPAGVMAIVFETTDRVLAQRQREDAERALRQASERLQLALASGVVLGTWVWEAETGELVGDDRFNRMLRIAADGDARQSVRRFLRAIHPAERADILAEVRASRSALSTYRRECRLRMAGAGYRWVLVSGKGELNEGGGTSRLAGVIVDIDDRKTAEDGLRELTRALESRVAQEVRARADAEGRLRQAQRLEAIGGLTGGIAHDFNNVLQTISSNLQLLEIGPRDEQSVRQRVDKANAAVARAAKLISQLLAFARRQPLSPTVIGPAMLMDSIHELLRRTLPESIQLDMTLCAEPWNFKVDRSQLENALLNLVINARDAISTQGRIAIEVANATPATDARLSGLAAPGDEFVRVAVSDNGGGMPESVKARAFEPFFSTKPDGHGTGLGLSMVFGFVRQSAGHVEIETALDRGTTVLLYFPRTLDPELGSAPDPESRNYPSGERVLVVEDNADVRLAAIEMLSQLGYRVISASDGDEALSILQRGERIDLLFTDVVMPGTIRSSELARIASAAPHDAKVLFVSGYTRDVIFHDGRLDDGVLLLGKPYTMDELSKAVRDALD